MLISLYFCRSFIKTLSKGDVPSTYEIHNRGGLWGCCQNVPKLLLKAQSEFDCTIKQNPRKIVAEKIVSKLDFKKFIVFSDKFSLHLQTNILKNIANLYVKTVAFGHAKQISSELTIEKPLCHYLKCIQRGDGTE